MTKYKTCTKCLQEQSQDNFYVIKKTNKLSSACKDCYHKANAQYRLSKRTYDLTRQRNYYKNNKTRLLEQKKSYYQKNIDTLRQQARNRTPEQRALVNKIYFLKHPDVLKMHRVRRKAKMRNAGIFKVTSKEIKLLMSLPCNYCQSSTNIQIDHIVPIARGGRHSIGNLMPLCQRCNAQKNSKTWFEFKIWKAKNC